jgi:peptidoglycan-associated lipoprotein
MGQHERRARPAVLPVLMLILLSACARRPAASPMAAPPPSGHAEQVATAPSEESPAAVAAPVETPRVEVAQPPTPEVSAPETPAPAPAREPEAATVPTEPATPPPAPEAPATATAPAPSEPAVVAAARPTAPVESRPADGLTTIHFDFDKYAIRPEDARILDENVAWLKANKRSLVVIEGHADERGTSEYNLALGSHRARAAVNYLVARGVQRSRMTMVSYGKERPLCGERTEECWAQNRRAQFLVKPQ